MEQEFPCRGFADLKSMLESVKGTVEMKPENRSRPEQKRVGGPFEVLPGIGLGPLRFRMTQAQVKEILGSPEESAEFDCDMHFYYDSLGILLFFSGEVRGILSGIEVNAHCCCTLAGRNLKATASRQKEGRRGRPRFRPRPVRRLSKINTTQAGADCSLSIPPRQRKSDQLIKVFFQKAFPISRKAF